MQLPVCVGVLTDALFSSTSMADRFSNRLHRELNQRSPDRFVVSNLADTGKDLLWVELLLKQLFADGFQIDTVVYVLCLNDIEGLFEENLDFYEGLKLHEPKWFLFRDTYFLNMLYFRVQQFTQPAVRDYYAHVQDYYAGRPWRQMRQKLTALRDLCAAQGTELRLVVFPFLHNLGSDYPFRGIHQQLSDACRDDGIPLLDLEPKLTPHATDGLIVNRFDAHPNARAHGIAAEAIRDWLVADQSVQQPPAEPQPPRK